MASCRRTLYVVVCVFLVVGGGRTQPTSPQESNYCAENGDTQLCQMQRFLLDMNQDLQMQQKKIIWRTARSARQVVASLREQTQETKEALSALRNITTTQTLALVSDLSEHARDTCQDWTDVRDRLRTLTTADMTEQSAIESLLGVLNVTQLMLKTMLKLATNMTAAQHTNKHCNGSYPSLSDIREVVQTELRNLKKKRDCAEVKQAQPTAESGVYTTSPDGIRDLRVYCDMETDNGGWTVIQRRLNGEIDFYRDWQSYAAGFGDVGGEFWLGNRNLHSLTQWGNYELRLDFSDWADNLRYAKYSRFAVGTESDQFPLSVGAFTGNAGDSLSYHNSMRFSTRDRDNDPHSSDCAEAYRGGWWYNGCFYSNPNGHYYSTWHYTPRRTGKVDGVEWYTWNNAHSYSLKTIEMKIRPLSI